MNVLANNPENNTLVPQQKLKPDEDRKDYLSNYYQENKAKLNTRKKELRRLAKEKSFELQKVLEKVETNPEEKLRQDKIIVETQLVKPVETSEPKFVETKENVETVETSLLVETKKQPEIIVETTRGNVETLKVSRVETFVKLPNIETRKKEIQPASSRKWGWNKNANLLFRCVTCQKDTKLEKVIRQQIPVKDETGKVLYGCFDYVYFCSGTCQKLGKNL